MASAVLRIFASDIASFCQDNISMLVKKYCAIYILTFKLPNFVRNFMTYNRSVKNKLLYNALIVFLL